MRLYWTGRRGQRKGHRQLAGQLTFKETKATDSKQRSVDTKRDAVARITTMMMTTEIKWYKYVRDADKNYSLTEKF